MRVAVLLASVLLVAAQSASAQSLIGKNLVVNGDAADGSGKGQAWILNNDLTANGTGNGAAAGSSITLFCAGLGALDGAAATGQMLTGGSVPKAKSAVTVKIGGQTATVTFAGAIPYGWPGIYQVVAAVPSGLAAGPQPVVVAAGSVSSPAGVTMVVK